jgi:hypothetical protein
MKKLFQKMKKYNHFSYGGQSYIICPFFNLFNLNCLSEL